MMEESRFDMDRLRSLAADRYLTVQRHPSRDLFVWNYAAKTQYERRWTPETLACRGLVLDAEGRVVSRPFGKFFNLPEHDGPLPDGEPEVYEKADGSLIVVSRHEGEPVVNSRGSFTSVQAAWTRAIFADRHGWDWVLDGFTYCFELIHPDNRIVVDYGGTDDVVLLAKIHTATGREADIHWGADEWAGLRAERFRGLSLDAVRDQDRENKEGYVLFWRAAGLRLKVKHAEYVRLHRLLTGVTARDVWEAMRTGGVEALVEGVPDEFHGWVKETEATIRAQFVGIENGAVAAYRAMTDPVAGAGGSMSRSEFAAKAAAYPSTIRPVLFRLWDERPYEEIVWKMVRPAVAVPFARDPDEAGEGVAA